jgi:hypothetical protein
MDEYSKWVCGHRQPWPRQYRNVKGQTPAAVSLDRAAGAYRVGRVSINKRSLKEDNSILN